MTGNINFVAATVGVFGVVGFLLLFLVRRSRRATKQKDSMTDVGHVENQNSRPIGAEDRPFQDFDMLNKPTPEKIIYRYLYTNYWKKSQQERSMLLPDIITHKDFKQVHRITHTSPPILIVYSKKSVWELGLSDRAEQGHREQFSFLMRGPESASNAERMRKMRFVINDLMEFRKVMCFSLFA